MQVSVVAVSLTKASFAQDGDQNGYTATSRSAHETVWQRVVTETNTLTGQITERIHRFVEVGSGLNYLNDAGQLAQSQDLVELSAEGGAAAVHGPLKVHFNANLNSAGAITITTASNRVLRTRPLAVVLFDAASGQAALIAALQDCLGEWVPPNQVVYKSAFGPLADVRLIYTKAGVESDVVLLQQPRVPEGWNPKTVRLEIWHEWLDAPEPHQTARLVHQESDPLLRSQMAEPDLSDQVLDFNDLWFPTGAAFSTDASTATGTNTATQVRVPNFARVLGLIPVAKSWVSLANRNVLIESVRWENLQTQLQRLTLTSQAGTLHEARALADYLDQLPAPPTQPAGQAISQAQSVYAPTGVVIDWIAVSGSGSYTFTNATYFVSSSTYFSGTLTFQPGCVIKFAPYAYLLTYGSIVCNGTSGSPSILTSEDDDLFGETLSWSTHNPGYAASQAVWDYFTSYGSTFQGMRIRWAYTGIQMDSYSGGTVTNCTFEMCQTGVYGPYGGYVTASVCGVETPYSPTEMITGNITDFCTGDSDWDGLPDVWEYQYFGNTGASPNTDSDGDGLTNLQEYQLGTNPKNADTDGDGMPDGWENTNAFNLLVNDASDDPDGDWLTNVQEYQGGTNPRDVMVVAWGNNPDGQCNVPEGLRNVTAVAGGLEFSLARTNGSVLAWGANNYGQANLPAGLTNVARITADFRQAGVAKSNGTVVAWGLTTGSVPADLTNAVSVAAGYSHMLALRNNGQVTAWGNNDFGKCIVPASATNVIAIAAGSEHSVALRANGTIVGWGQNAAAWGWNLTNPPAGLSNVVAIAAGDYHNLALKSDGTVVAWGAGNGTNLSGNFLNSEQGQSIVPAGLSNVVAIAAGGYRSLALRANGTIVGWGDNLFGQGTAPPGVTNLTAIAAAPNHTLAIRAGRQLPIIVQHPSNQAAPAGSNVTFTAKGLGLAGVKYQWQFNGVNISGATNATLTLNNVQAGNVGNYQVIISTGAGSFTSTAATFTLITPPVIVSQTQPDRQWAPLTPVLVLTVQASGPFLSYQWKLYGTNLPGATSSNYYVASFDGNEEREYSCVVSNAAAVTNSVTWKVKTLNPGGVAAWGNNDYGQLDWPASASNVIAVAAGEFHSVVVREDGSVLQWGYEWDDVPASLTNAIAVAAGYDHTIALRDNGTVAAWGDAGNYANNVPTNLTGVKAIACGWHHNVALLTNGNVTAWGLNGAELGWHLTEVPANLTNATAIAAGALHSLALRTDGTVVGWGYSDAGQTNVPSGLSNVVGIAAGGSHSLALKADGTVTAWGLNSSGQCSVPSGLSNVMAIAAGWAHSAALKNDGTVVCWGDNSETQADVGGGLKGIKLLAARGEHTLASAFSSLVQYQVDVSRDLLLIYNSTSTNSIWVKDYYLAHRPMVAGANVLGIGCTTNETFLPAEFTNNCAVPVLNWLVQNPTKHPQYIILFLDIPSRVNTNNTPGVYQSVLFAVRDSVSVQLYDSFPGIKPFITHINMNGTNDCRAYIDKLRHFGTNYSPGKLIISASANGYGNTNYVADDVHHEDYGLADEVTRATNGLVSAGVSPLAILFRHELEPCINGILAGC